MYDPNMEGTVLDHLTAITEEVGAAWTEGDVEAIARVSQIITAVKFAVGEAQKTFDNWVDRRDAGEFGEDFATPVVRMRAKSDKVGRPAKPKVDKLAALK